MNFILFLCEGTHWIAKVIENIPNAEITLTSPIELGDISKFEELKMCCKRRVIPTHLSYNMLPVDIKQKQCKVSSMVKGRRLGMPQNWAWILALPLSGCVTLGNCWCSLSLSFLNWYRNNVSISYNVGKIRQDNACIGLTTVSSLYKLF